jgi:hypothetical protein
VPQLATGITTERRTLLVSSLLRRTSQPVANLMLSSMHSVLGWRSVDALPFVQQVRQLDAAELICAGTAASTLEPRYNLSGCLPFLALWLVHTVTRESRTANFVCKRVSCAY